MDKAEMNTGKKRFFAILIVATAVVVFICMLFVYQIRQTTEAETQRYLSELSSSVVYSVDARLQANLDALDSIAITYVERKDMGREKDLTYLQRKAKVHKFVSVFVMDTDGNAVGSDGTSRDFSGAPEIMKALDGEKVVVNDALIYGETQNGFAYAVPIQENGKITGALVACNTTEWIKNLLDQTYFDGEGFFHILSGDGSFIVKSNSPYAMDEEKNFLKGLEEDGRFDKDSSLEQLKGYINDDKAGTVYFTMNQDKVSKIGKVIPLSYHGYYLFLVVTEEAASQQFDTLLIKGIWNILIITLLFLSLVVILYVINLRHNKQLSTLAFVDPVTKGYSQIRFETQARELIKNAPAGTYAFISLNIANFKLINDTFGTHDGDRILKHVHDITRDNLVGDQLISRSFSDNFDLLIKAGGQEKIIDTIGQIAQKVNEFNNNSATKYYLLFTVGVYLIEDKSLSVVHIRDRANVARKSDTAAIGGDLFTCVFYSDLERLKQRRNKELENKMTDALENGDFIVHLQPKVSVKDRAIVGAEALVRWKDKEWGLIPPNEFIPFFEENHFIIEVDLYVFEQVCKTLRGWLDTGVDAVPISVNLSRVHLKEKDFLQRFVQIQQKYQIPAQLLEMELTETILAENLDLVTNVVDQIHQLGFACSIDDFGSGYSSLNLLKSVNADILKLDGAFFGSSKADDPRERVIVEAVVKMAQKLSMKTVAEGVETTEQLDALRTINCDMVQGYVIAKPMEIEEFERMITNNF